MAACILLTVCNNAVHGKPGNGLVTGSPVFAKDARLAREFMADFDSEMNILKGSNQNDGLVALESQYIPKSYKLPGATEPTIILNNVLGNTTKGYVEPNEMKKYNHKNIAENKDAFKIAYEMVLEARILRGR